GGRSASSHCLPSLTAETIESEAGPCRRPTPLLRTTLGCGAGNRNATRGRFSAFVHGMLAAEWCINADQNVLPPPRRQHQIGPTPCRGGRRPVFPLGESGHDAPGARRLSRFDSLARNHRDLPPDVSSTVQA